MLAEALLAEGLGSPVADVVDVGRMIGVAHCEVIERH